MYQGTIKKNSDMYIKGTCKPMYEPLYHFGWPLDPQNEASLAIFKEVCDNTP